MGRGGNLLYNNNPETKRSSFSGEQAEYLLTSEEDRDWQKALILLFKDNNQQDLNRLAELYPKQLIPAIQLPSLSDAERSHYLLNYSYLAFIKDNQLLRRYLFNKIVPWVKSIRYFNKQLNQSSSLIHNKQAQDNYLTTVKLLTEQQLIERYFQPRIALMSDNYYCLKSVDNVSLCKKSKSPSSEIYSSNVDINFISKLAENQPLANKDYPNIGVAEAYPCPDCVAELQNKDQSGLATLVRKEAVNQEMFIYNNLKSVKETVDELADSVYELKSQSEFEQFLIDRIYRKQIDRHISDHNHAVVNNYFFSTRRATETDRLAYLDVYDSENKNPSNLLPLKVA